MTSDQFWQIIDDSRAAAARGEDQLTYLENAVQALPPREMVSFEGHCWDLLSLSFRRELWAVGSILQPGCSRGSFDAMRAWMILQGKDFFDRINGHPERLGEHIPPGPIPWSEPGEHLLRIVPHHYRRATGEEMPTVPRKIPYVLKGNRWSEHELPELYPELWRKYRG